MIGSFGKGTAPVPYRCRRQWIRDWTTRASGPGLRGRQVPVAVGVAAMTRPRFRAYPVKGPRTEAGAALLAFLLVLLVGGSYALLRDAKSLAQRAKLEESRKTSEALAEAKAALIGYAVSRQIDPNCTAPGNNCARPGDLPCPDINNDGEIPATGTGSSCGNASGSSGQASRLARLPWRTLDLGDLRDGAGERLWYAVSATFKANTRSICTSPASSGCLNSDTRGRITVKVAGGDTDGDGAPDDVKVLHDGRNPDWRNTAERVNPAAQWAPSGALAVLIAPGKPLKRQDGITQNRGGACETASTTSCARNYLDVGLGEDNAIFYDGPTLSNRGNGFIAGDVLGNCDDGDCDVIVNDRILPITYQDIIPVLEKRVVGEVLACVRAYAEAHGGRVPWAASINDVTCSDPGDTPDRCYFDKYSSDHGSEPVRFGRIPDYPFARTESDGSNPSNPAEPNNMSNSWLEGCTLRQASKASARWWRNWKEFVFYGVANAYEPQPVPPQSTPDRCGADGKCLAVNPPLPPSPDPLPPCVGSTHVVVIASGKRLPAVPDDPEPQTAPSGMTTDQKRQSLAETGDILNYLESYNATVEGDSSVDPQGPCIVLPSPSYVYFRSGNATKAFNDVVGYLPQQQP